MQVIRKVLMSIGCHQWRINSETTMTSITQPITQRWLAVNQMLMSHPIIRPPGFDLRHQLRSIMN